MNEGLVYVGKIINLEPIPGADFIVSATVICGEGGKWKGIVRKSDFSNIGELAYVFLPDALLPESDLYPFMKDSGWRVKMRRFKGAASEVLILPFSLDRLEIHPLGLDVTTFFGVTKYHKPVPAHLQGLAKGHFPDFIPKTDELNYQRYPELVDSLVGNPWYMTEKCDGSSTTAYKWKGQFGVCSRNLELEKNLENGYWKVAEKYRLEQLMPEGLALQWETCGPGIQSNPMGLNEIDGFLFSAYYIEEKRYCTFLELIRHSATFGFPMAKVLGYGFSFVADGLETKGEGLYSNGNQREGVVIRSQNNQEGHKPISFKVINLGYEK